MKKTLQLITVALLLLLSTTIIKAQDANGDGFHDGDVNILFNIDYHNPSNTLNWDGTNYGSWSGVEWTTTFPRRITSLKLVNKRVQYLKVAGCTYIESIDCHDDINSAYNVKTLDVSGCTGLKTLNCANNDIWYFKVNGCSSLETLNCSENEIENLDVSGLSRLTNLDCSINPLKSLNTSGCRALVNFNFTTRLLEKLDISRCESLETLDCSAGKLTTLNIDYCLALTSVDCHQNQLSSINLDRASALTTLNCSKNKITNLPVSGNSKLNTINCEVNRLTALDVSGCKALQTVKCNNNLLTSINISDCESLTTLNCQSNKITSLNFSDRNILTTLLCNNNQLTSLDVSGSTQLTKLDCFSNKLVLLDVSNLPFISNLNSSSNLLTELNINGCSKLETVNCKNNKLTSLDINQSSSLIKLDCSNNSFTTLDLSVCNSIEEVDCSNNNLSTLNINGATSLKSFKCSFNEITLLDISGNTSLSTLYCDNNKITDFNASGCLALSNFRFEENPFDSFNISGCNLITNLSGKAFNVTNLNISGCTAIWSLSLNRDIIESLNANGCSLLRSTPFYSAGYSTSYYNFPNLKSLDFSGCSSLQRMEFRAIELLTLKIDNCPSLESFKLSGGNTSELNFAGCVSLNELKVSSNKATSINLSDCIALKTVDFGYSKFTSLDLSNCKELTSLVCHGRSITNLNVKGCALLTEIFCPGLGDCKLDISGLVSLKKVLMADGDVTSVNASGCIALERLECEKNKITSIDVSGCSSLESISASENKITSINLTGCNSLKYLNCSDNFLTNIDVSDCIELLSLSINNNEFKTIDITANTKLSSLGCKNNRLPISQLKRGIGLTGTFGFSPQKKIFNERFVQLGNEIDFSLEEFIGETATEFKWYRNSVYLPDVKTAKFTPTEEGIYHCSMTNTMLYSYNSFVTNNILVASDNNAPTDIIISNSFINENKFDTNREVGILSCVDADEFDLYTYTIVENPLFFIEDNTLIANKTFNFEVDPTNYSVTVMVTDIRGLSFSKEITLTIVDRNDKPVINIERGEDFLENSPIGTVIGTIDVTDEDINDEVTYVMRSYSSPGFEIIDDKIVSTKLFDHESNAMSLHVYIEAVDKLGAKSYKYIEFYVIDVNENPTDITLTENTVAENTAIGSTFVGSFKVIDPDYNDKHTFTISDDRFTIHQTYTQYLVVNSNLDFETSKEHKITITATDKDGLSLSKEFTIYVTDVNEAPIDVVLSLDKIAENSIISTEVGVISGLDQDADDIVSVTISENEYFELKDDKLVTKTTFDFESTQEYTINATATDKAGLTFNKILKVYVTNENEAPTDITISNNTIAENSAIGTEVGALITTDIDKDDEFTYTIAQNDNFKVEGDKLVTKSLFDFETDATSYKVSVTATDKAGLFVEKELEITLTDVNETPTALVLSNNVIAEDAAIGTEVCTLSATDIDANDVLTYTIIENNNFKVEGGKLVTKSTFDFETETSYNIAATATDKAGLFVEKEFTINITDVNEAPANLALSANTVAEDAAIGTKVGTLSATDVDANDELTYSIIENDNFKVEGDKLVTKTTFDFETETSYNIAATATDKAGLKIEKELFVTITNVNEAPTSLSLSNNVIAENSAIGTEVGTLSTADVDQGDEFTYIITDNENFTVNDDKLVTKSTFDFETDATSYKVTIESTDKAGLKVDKEFTITIENVNEAPTALALSANKIAENATVGTEIGTLSSAEVDANDVITYTVNNSKFKVEGDKLVTNSEFDFESEESYQVEITATDIDGLDVKKEFTITIENVNEAPTTLAISSSQIAENSIVGTEVGTISATDADANDVLTYTIAENDNFKLEGDKIVTKTAFDFETKASYTVNATATDKAGLKVEKEIAITITNVNESPTDLALSNNVIAEDVAIGTEVGTLSATDVDANDVLAYTIAASDNFKVEGDRLVTKSTFDFETKSEYKVTVTVTDAAGLSDKKEFTITITNINEAPTALSLSNNTIAENATIGTEVSTLSATDVDANDELTYTIADNDNFKVEGDKLVTKSTLDYETKSEYKVIATATDTDGLKVEKEFVINITNVNEAPSVLALSNNTIAEDATIGTEVGTLSANDVDANDLLTYTIANNENFKIEGDKLVTKSTFDYDTKSEYKVTVTATDKGGLKVEKEFTITITEAKATAINKTVSGNVKLYPNPAVTTVTIKTTVIINRVDIVNVSGTVVYSNIVNTTNTTVDVSNLQSGIYTLRGYTSDGVITKQFVKK